MPLIVFTATLILFYIPSDVKDMLKNAIKEPRPENTPKFPFSNEISEDDSHDEYFSAIIRQPSELGSLDSTSEISSSDDDCISVVSYDCVSIVSDESVDFMADCEPINTDSRKDNHNFMADCEPINTGSRKDNHNFMADCEPINTDCRKDNHNFMADCELINNNSRKDNHNFMADCELINTGSQKDNHKFQSFGILEKNNLCELDLLEKSNSYTEHENYEASCDIASLSSSSSSIEVIQDDFDGKMCGI